MGHFRRFRQSKSLADVAASIRGLAKRSKRLVKVLRIELAVTRREIDNVGDGAHAGCGQRKAGRSVCLR